MQNPLFDETYSVSKSLVLRYGLDEAFVLQKLHTLLSGWSSDLNDYDKSPWFIYRDNTPWVLVTLDSWQKSTFPFFSLEKLKRCVSSLLAKNAIAIIAFSEKTSPYFTIRYDDIWDFQSVQSEPDFLRESDEFFQTAVSEAVAKYEANRG